MDIVIADAAGKALRQTDDYTLDLAYGDDENDFQLSDLTGPALANGMRWWIDGTAYGGIVDDIGIDSEDDAVTARSYKGRSVQGVMAKKIIRPDAGQSHLVVTGEANTLIDQLLTRCSVNDWLTASTADSGIQVSSYQFYRYIDLWAGLRMMLASAGARPDITFIDGRPVISAVSSTLYGDIPSERVSFSAERTYRPTNHLIGLGTGEGAARQVADWYANAQGVVSQTQTLFGLDEVVETYDLSNENEDLSGKTKNKLQEYQGQGTFEVDLPDGTGLDVGDRVTASDADTGLSVTADVVKVVVKVKSGTPSISYETGTPQWPEEED